MLLDRAVINSGPLVALAGGWNCCGEEPPLVQRPSVTDNEQNP